MRWCVVFIKANQGRCVVSNNVSQGQCVLSKNVSQGRCVVPNKVSQTRCIVANIDNMFWRRGPIWQRPTPVLRSDKSEVRTDFYKLLGNFSTTPVLKTDTFFSLKFSNIRRL